MAFSLETHRLLIVVLVVLACVLAAYVYIVSRRLTRASNLFHYALDASPIAAFIKDPEGRVIFVNRAFSEITGLDNDDFQRCRSVADQHRLWPDTAGGEWTNTDQLAIDLRQPVSRSYTLRMPKRTGRVVLDEEGRARILSIKSAFEWNGSGRHGIVGKMIIESDLQARISEFETVAAKYAPPPSLEEMLSRGLSEIGTKLGSVESLVTTGHGELKQELHEVRERVGGLQRRVARLEDPEETQAYDVDPAEFGKFEGPL